MDFTLDQEELTVGACQRYLQEVKAKKSTKAKDRPSARGRHSDMTKWKVRTPEMTEEEYQEAIRIHRNELARKWRKANPDYQKKYMKKYRKAS